MAGNKNSGRKKLPTAMKKARGTYRKDRDKKTEEVEKYLSESEIHSEILPPQIITDNYVKEAYIEHSRWLSRYGQLCSIDISEFDQMFITLQQLREVTIQRIAMEKDGAVVKNLEDYTKISKLELSLRKTFIEMGKDFLMTPAVRSKLTIEQLTADKLAAEKKEREVNMMEDLFSEEKK